MSKSISDRSSFFQSLLLTILFSPLAFGDCTPDATHHCVVFVHGSGSAPANLTGTITDIPQAPLTTAPFGAMFANFDATNNFDMTTASTYPDGTPGDWIQASMSVVDDLQDVILRKQVSGRSTPPISNYQFSGVTGFGGTVSNPTYSYHHFDVSDNDGSTINWYLMAGVRPNCSRSGCLPNPFGNSSTLIACAPGGVAIANCGEFFTVMPPKAGTQGLHIWIVAYDTPAITITATQADGKTYTGTVPALPAGGYAEKVVDITLNTPVVNSPVSLSVIQTGTPTTSDSAFGVKAVVLGSISNGGVDPSTVSAIYNGGLGGTVGARTFQVDPPTRVPASTTTVTLCSVAVTTGCVTEGIQTAINNAQSGAIATGGVDIILPADYAETGNFTFSPFSGGHWLRIVAANYRGYGQRAYETDTMPTLTTNNDQAVFTCSGNSGCNNINLVGLKLNSSAPAQLTYYLVSFSPSQNPPVIFPHDIIIQGCHIHGGLLNTIVGVRIDGNAWGLYDNYVDHFGSDFKEGNAVAWDSGAGPITFKNNYFNASTEDVITGGGPSLANIETRDVEITGNWFDKDDLSCYVVMFACGQGKSRPGVTPAYDNAYANIKNHREFKQGQYITVKGNLFTHGYGNDNSPSDQKGQFMTFYQRDANYQISRGIDNVDVENNIMRHGTYGITLGPFDNKAIAAMPYFYSGNQHDITIKNNLFQDISYSKYGPGDHQSAAIYTSGIPMNFIVDHNTVQFATDGTDSPYNDLFIYQAWFGKAQMAAFVGLTPSYGGIFGVLPFSPDSVNSTATQLTNNSFTGTAATYGGGTLGGIIAPNSNFTNNIITNSVPAGNNDVTNDPWSFTHGYGTASAAFFPLPTSWAASNMINGVGSVTGTPGVNMALIPSDCLLYTGNRSDLPCTPGQ